MILFMRVLKIEFEFYKIKTLCQFWCCIKNVGHRFPGHHEKAYSWRFSRKFSHLTQFWLSSFIKDCQCKWMNKIFQQWKQGVFFIIKLILNHSCKLGMNLDESLFLGVYIVCVKYGNFSESHKILWPTIWVSEWVGEKILKQKYQ